MEMFRQVHAKIGSSMRLKADAAFRDLSEVFADSEELVFIDYCHTTELANARIASLIADGVIAKLEARVSEQRKSRPPRWRSGAAVSKLTGATIPFATL